MKLGTFIMGCALALLACTFAGCDDRLEVRQAYDFSLSSWYLQEGIAPDETVEIRLTLDREGDYREARYRIGYIQLEGDGEVSAADGNQAGEPRADGTLRHRGAGHDGHPPPGVHPFLPEHGRGQSRDPLRGGGQLRRGTDAGHPVLHRGQGKYGYNRLTGDGSYDGTG